MKTTFDLPDKLIRETQNRATQEGRKLEDLLAEAIRIGLEIGSRRSPPTPLPLMKLAKIPGKARPLSLAESCELIKAAELGTDTRPG